MYGAFAGSVGGAGIRCEFGSCRPAYNLAPWFESLVPLATAMKHAPFSDTQLAAASRLFSSGVVRELGRGGRSATFSRLARESGLLEAFNRGGLVRDFFDLAFRVLRRWYRDEYVYKAAITRKKLLGVHSLRTAALLTEFRVGSCKADAVLLNGSLRIYEIKSDRDKLERLSTQIGSYLQAFSEVYVITGDGHLEGVLKLVPSEVGVIMLTERETMCTVRRAANEPGRIVPEVLFDALRTDEAALVLSRLGVTAPETPNTQRRAEYKNLFARCDAVALHDATLHVLKRSRSQLHLKNVVDSLPCSLKPAALTTPLRRRDHSRLCAAVNSPLEDGLSWA